MYHDSANPNNNDQLQPQFTTNGTTWSNIGAAVSRYNKTTGWSQTSVDVTPYIGKAVYLGFVGISAKGNDIYLDNLNIMAQ